MLAFRGRRKNYSYIYRETVSISIEGDCIIPRPPSIRSQKENRTHLSIEIYTESKGTRGRGKGRGPGGSRYTVLRWPIRCRYGPKRKSSRHLRGRSCQRSLSSPREAYLRTCWRGQILGGRKSTNKWQASPLLPSCPSCHPCPSLLPHLLPWEEEP